MCVYMCVVLNVPDDVIGGGKPGGRLIPGPGMLLAIFDSPRVTRAGRSGGFLLVETLVSVLSFGVVAVDTVLPRAIGSPASFS